MEDIFYLLDNIYTLTAIPAHCIHHDTRKVLYSIGFQDNCNPIKSDSDITKSLTHNLGSADKPYLEFENGIFIYGIMSDPSGIYIILGPCTFGSIESIFCQKYAERHNLTNKPRLIASPLAQFIAALLTIYFARTGVKLPESDIILGHNFDTGTTYMNSFSQAYVMENSENDVQRLSYGYETTMLKQIREGNVESILAIQKNETTSSYLASIEDQMGQTAVNKSKHFEYIVCTAIALFCRAAMDGGMDTLNAYALSDVFLQRLEKCTSVTDMMKLSYEAQLEYASHVRHILDRKRRSSYVEKAKSYIANHLNKVFSLSDVSSAIGVSRSYLTQQFSQEEGIGLMEYTRNKRIEAAANMLRYSDESISTIASYLCFNSQSHFGASFKKIMGVTPRKYREENILVDIISDKKE